MSGSTVLITGVAGMVGSHLLDALLLRGDRVIGIDDLSYGSLDNIRPHLDDPNFRFYRISVLERDALQVLCKDVDIVCHLAAVKKIGEADSSLPTLSINTEGTQHVLDVARMWGAKVVFASTSDVYGMSPDIPFREDGDLLLGPSMIRRWSYAVSKLYGEQLAFAYHRDFGVPVVILRFFGGFSPRASFAWSGGHIPMFIRAVLRDEEVTIHGDGTQTRSMAYVDDLVAGTLLAMDCEDAVGEVINIGNDEEMSVLDSARLIHELSGSTAELRLNFVPFNAVFGAYKDIQRRIPDLTKSRELLGYAPKVSLRDAIQTTIDSAREQLTRDV